MFLHSLPKRSLAACWLLVILLLGSCLKFGEQNEWLAPDVTDAHIEEIRKITSIALPAGTEGLAYLYDGEGIDDAMAAKLRIPSDKVDALMAADIFTKGNETSFIHGRGPGESWWKPETLSSQTARAMQLHGNEFLSCILGQEGADHILYISWFDT